MNNYELMVIFSPLLNEESYRELTKKYQSFLKEKSAEIVHTASWGLKSLSYPIQKKTTGFYFIVEYKASGDVNQKLAQQLLRDDQVMRHLIVHLDKHAVAYNLKKRTKKEEQPQFEAAAPLV